jgi:hypothetical protein
MHGCDLLFTPKTAENVKRAVRDSQAGGQCACDLDLKCPLLPADIGALLKAAPDAESSAA